ncbi:MAG TPA: hypothetical protein VK085_11145 [Pseudogracilibacillus sp.]|nr:hypothetical protein [Pseudogracilibacillus sp.]
MVKVKNDWTWVAEHVNEELKNEALYDEVLEYANESNIDIDRVKELYHDGIDGGMENGEYLSFSQWFYEFKKEGF